MSRTVRIDRLRIRLPAAQAAAPKTLAADVARQLAAAAAGWKANKISAVRATAVKGDAGSIAAAVDRGVRSK